VLHALLLFDHLAQVEPIGLVPVSTQVPGIESRVPLFQLSCCIVRLNSSGCFMKQSSVSGSEAGQSLYWYPPPATVTQEQGHAKISKAISRATVDAYGPHRD
jgi:hypothetical protein